MLSASNLAVSQMTNKEVTLSGLRLSYPPIDWG